MTPGEHQTMILAELSVPKAGSKTKGDTCYKWRELYTGVCLSVLSHVMYILTDFFKIYHVETFYLRIKFPMTSFITISFVRVVHILHRRKISIAKVCIYLNWEQVLKTVEKYVLFLLIG